MEWGGVKWHARRIVATFAKRPDQREAELPTTTFIALRSLTSTWTYRDQSNKALQSTLKAATTSFALSTP
ncbi:unnamed protein product [Zymoseptoria tritici ST99CH_3D7]|uniref:Uncharacterized protein n=1 Tax=Zymoseptoria tritici (strain ST99CH_3D7) TaxID=1276538 RepID=A0A1X7S330_ZYMT9|nr:unnamed protein product [Zymoseptoria tritici ST99CH_3D7]